MSDTVLNPLRPPPPPPRRQDVDGAAAANGHGPAARVAGTDETRDATGEPQPPEHASTSSAPRREIDSAAAREVAVHANSGLRDQLHRRFDAPDNTDTVASTSAARQSSSIPPALETASARNEQYKALKALDAETRSSQDQLKASNSGIVGNAPQPQNGVVTKPRPQPQPDPEVRRRVEAEIARRLGPQRAHRAREIADRMARALGNGNMQRGMAALDRALRNGRLNVGLAGIHGPRGGPRSDEELADTRHNMSTTSGREVDAVLDNDGGVVAGRNAHVNQEQLRKLRETAELAHEIGLPLDVTVHSNGFNTLRAYAADPTNPRLGNVTLINPNIPGDPEQTRAAFRNIVQRSDHVRLVTSIDDDAVPLSAAGGNGPVWQQQINAAVAAGVQDIRVLTGANHNLDSMAAHINQPGALDLRRNPRTGRLEPVNPEAWLVRGYQWHPGRGLHRIGIVPRDHRSAA
ncbi:MAG: hypothetical protein AB2A00_23455 [Myxococcota bacterium]